MPLDKARTLVGLGLAGHVAAAIAIIFAYQSTGSSALLALAIMFLVVVAHHAVLMSGLREAANPADARHPFGHGRELYFWCFVAAVLLFAHGAGVAIFEGISKLKSPVFLSLGTVAQTMLFCALVVQAAIAYGWTTAWPGSHRDSLLTGTSDPVRTAVAVDNAAATVAVLVCLAGLNAAEHSGMRTGDAAAALAIGFIMAAVAAFMCVRTKAVLVGQAATPTVRTAVRSLLQSELGSGRPIAAVQDIKTLELGGGDLLVAAAVRFKQNETARAVADATARLQQSVAAELPQVSEFFLSVTADPATQVETSTNALQSQDRDAALATTSPAPHDGQAALADAGQNHPDPPQAGGPHRGGRKKRRH
jgi:cation diffusion facilitator family transporter